jgi:hypothetical protein
MKSNAKKQEDQEKAKSTFHTYYSNSSRFKSQVLRWGSSNDLLQNIKKPEGSRIQDSAFRIDSIYCNEFPCNELKRFSEIIGENIVLKFEIFPDKATSQIKIILSCRYSILYQLNF